MAEAIGKTWKEIAVGFLKVGATLGVAWRFKVPEPVLIAAGAVAGLIIFAVR